VSYAPSSAFHAALEGEAVGWHLFAREDRDAARAIALRLYRSIRSQHDWGRQFEPDPPEAVLEQFAQLAPREMRRAWMTAFGNARLDRRSSIEQRDLPEAGGRRQPIGFTH